MLRITPRALVVAAACILWCGPTLPAQCLPIVCKISISIQSDPSGITLGGSGTNAATMAFGSMQAYGGSSPTGVTKSVGASSFTVSTPFDVVVSCVQVVGLLPCTLLQSPTYSMTAQLQTADSTNTWKIAGSTLSTSPTTLVSAGSYYVVTAYTFALIIPFTEVAGTVTNTVNFVAMAN